MYRETLAAQAEAHDAGDVAAVSARPEQPRDVVTHVLKLPFVSGSGFVAADELVAALQPYSAQADAFRDLAAAVRLAFPAGKLERPLAILSPERGDGKTYLAANLAIALAAEGRTLLIDANMRTPRLHAMFGLRPGAGLSELLCGDVEASVIHTIADLQGLHFMAAGGSHANPIQLLHGPRFGLLLDEVARRFDAVVIDTPADLQGPDARVIAARAGAALVVGREDRTRVPDLQALTDKLQRAHAIAVGLVVNAH